MLNYNAIISWQKAIQEADPDSFGLASLNGVNPGEIFFQLHPELCDTYTKNPDISAAQVIATAMGISPETVASIVYPQGYAPHSNPTPDQVADRITDVIAHEGCIIHMLRAHSTVHHRTRWKAAVMSTPDKEPCLLEDPIESPNSVVGRFAHSYIGLLPADYGEYYTKHDYISAMARILDTDVKTVKAIATQEGYGGGTPTRAQVADRIQALIEQAYEVERVNKQIADFHANLRKLIDNNRELVNVGVIDSILTNHPDIDDLTLEFLNDIYVGLTGFDHNRIIQRQSW